MVKVIKTIKNGTEYINEGFEPSNAGTTGQVLTKMSNGYGRDDAPEGFDPSNAGTAGQVLVKTSNGYDWENAPEPARTVSVKKTEIFNQSTTSSSINKTYTAPSDGFITYYLRAGGYYAHWDLTIGGQYLVSYFSGAESGSARSTSGTFYIEKGATVVFSKYGSNDGSGNAYFRSYQGK